MKKFLKWSTAFLVLGVLAVGCIKNEPSSGIEAMRQAKAELLKAQASLLQAEEQVKAAEAALKQAEAKVIAAHIAIIEAQARQIDAETALKNEQKKWNEALREFHTAAWAIRIQEMEEDLRARKAETDLLVAQWELQIEQLQAQFVEARQNYEEALLRFELWKMENLGTLSQALIIALDDLTAQIQDILLQLGEAEVELNYAKAMYLWYTKVTYPEDMSEIRLDLETYKMLLECEVEYLTGIVAAYQAIYDNYHGELHGLMAEFQDMINFLREEIAKMEIRYIELQEEIFWQQQTVAAAQAPLTLSRKLTLKNVFSDKGGDPNIRVNGKSEYIVQGPWSGSGNMFALMSRDLYVINDTRVQMQEDQESGLVQANIKAKETARNNAAAAYKKNWDAWQSNYDKARIASDHVGSLYTAWISAWQVYDKEKKDYFTHLGIYDSMYSDADSLINLFMDHLDNWLLGQGNLVVPGSATISEILGGIKFDAGTLAQFIFEGNAQAFIDVLNTIIAIIDKPAAMDAIVTELKGLMDGTHPEGYPPFWEHATSWRYDLAKNEVMPYKDIMRAVYGRQGRELTEITKNEWYVWLFLYWLFEDRTVELGLDGPNGGPVVTINPGKYDDAAKQVLWDFFGRMDKAAYQAKMNSESSYSKNPKTALFKAIENYFKAITALTGLEEAMFNPFGRSWYVVAQDTRNLKGKKSNNINEQVPFVITENMVQTSIDGYTGLYYYELSPFLIGIAPNPSKYTPPRFNDTLPYANQPSPTDATQFFFKLEAYKDRTGPIPSVDFDITYLDDDCNLVVNFTALVGVTDDCGVADVHWTGDMILWEWANKGASYVKSGHYFYAVVQDRDYKSYQTIYNRVVNGEYDDLYDRIEALYIEQWGLYQAALSKYTAENNKLTTMNRERTSLSSTIGTYELLISFYQDLIDQAWDAHNGGNLADDGLLSALYRAKERLLEKQNELNKVVVALELLDEEFNNEAPIYQAQIEVILQEIIKLQQQLQALEAIRAKLLAEYL